MACLCIGSNADAICDDLALLSEAAHGSLKVRECLFDALNTDTQLVRVHGEVFPAGVAGECRIRFELADGLRDLVSAIRAGEADFLVVQRSSHGHPSRKMV